MPIKKNSKQQDYQDGANVNVSSFLDVEHSDLEHKIIGKNSELSTQRVISHYLSSKKQENTLMEQQESPLLENPENVGHSSGLKLNIG